MNTRANYRVVGVHGAPRSGTSWLGQLLNSSPQVAYRYQPFFAYKFRDRLDNESNPHHIRDWFDELLETGDEFVLQIGRARLARSMPEFCKSQATHLVYKEVRFHHLIEHLMECMPDARFIGIVRDPRDVLSSWFRAPREFDPSWTLNDEWRHAGRKNAGRGENWYGFDRWKELAGLFMRLSARFPDRFRLIRYEDLTATPSLAVVDLFAFCGIPFTAQTAEFIERSTQQDDGEPYGVFRSHRRLRISGELPDDIEEAIESELTGTVLAQFLKKND